MQPNWLTILWYYYLRLHPAKYIRPLIHSYTAIQPNTFVLWYTVTPPSSQTRSSFDTQLHHHPAKRIRPLIQSPAKHICPLIPVTNQTHSSFDTQLHLHLAKQTDHSLITRPPPSSPQFHLKPARHHSLICHMSTISQPNRSSFDTSKRVTHHSSISQTGHPLIHHSSIISQPNRSSFDTSQFHHQPAKQITLWYITVSSSVNQTDHPLIHHSSIISQPNRSPFDTS